MWIAAFLKNDRNHEAGKQIIKAITEGRIGVVSISDYIFNEIVTYIRKKCGYEASYQVARAILDSPHVSISIVDENTFNAAFHVFQMFERLSFTDATSVVLMKNHKLRNLFSFDSDFDTITEITRLTNLNHE